MPVSASLALLVGTAFLCGVWSGTRGRLACAALALASVRWLLIDPIVEGRVLLRIDDHHGFVESDIAGLVGLALAAARFAFLSREWLGQLRRRAAARARR